MAEWMDRKIIDLLINKSPWWTQNGKFIQLIQIRDTDKKTIL